jgi:hypothetical protein
MKPTVIVWARSPQWCSAISRQLGQFRLSWVLNFESLWSEVLKIDASAVVIEIPDSSLDSLPGNLARLHNNSFKIKTFTVGKLPNPLWERELRKIGNCGHHGTAVEFAALATAIQRHHQSRIPTEKSIEQNVWTNLPWPTP